MTARSAVVSGRSVARSRDPRGARKVPRLAFTVLGATALLLLSSGLLPVPTVVGPWYGSGGGPTGGVGPTSRLSAEAASYAVNFSETGLAARTNWGVNLSSSSGGSFANSTRAWVPFSEPNGSYRFDALALGGSYLAIPSYGSFNVSGAAVHIAVRFMPRYAVTFAETGLAGGAAWSVDLNGTTATTTSTSLAYSEIAASYPYSVSASSGATPTPSRGVLNVTGATNVSIAFSPVTTYTLSVVESGLPTGTSWTAVVNGASNSSTTSRVGFAEANGTYAFQIPSVGVYSPSPASGAVSIIGKAVSLSITFTPLYAVHFTEVGLATGTPWSVRVGPASGSSSHPWINLSVANGSYTFYINLVPGYYPNLTSGTMKISGSAVYLPVRFALKAGFYALTFDEVGLPGNSTEILNWSVDIAPISISNVSQSSALSFGLNNGSYTFTVVPPSYYSATPASGAVAINGANASLLISFARAMFTLSFTETGLPSGTPWSVNVTSGATTNSSLSSGPTVSFRLPAGTYSFDIGPAARRYASPSNGTIAWNGTNRTVGVRFLPAYPNTTVTFAETGLAGGTSWSVQLANTTKSSTTSSIAFTAPNGTFAYSVPAVAGYSAQPVNGTVVIAGTAVTVAIQFSSSNGGSPAYAVTFTESGLPNGTSWTVAVNGTSQGSTSATIRVALDNGTYAWAASATVNGTTVNSNGSLTVQGASVAVRVAFLVPSPPLVSLSFVATGIGMTAVWSVTLTASSGGLVIDTPATVARSAVSSSSIVFRVSTGSYAYLARSDGYRALSGNVSVLGATTPPTVSIAFLPVSTGPSGGEGPLPLPTWAAGIGVALVVIGALGLSLTIRRTRRLRIESGEAAVRQLLSTEWEADEHGDPQPRPRR